MRLLLFSLFLVSVSALSAPVDEAESQQRGVVRHDREDPPVPEDCCEARETPCWLETEVHCYEGEWMAYTRDRDCFFFFEYYGCCGRCECNREGKNVTCSEKHRLYHAPFQPDVTDEWYNPAQGSPP